MAKVKQDKEKTQLAKLIKKQMNFRKDPPSCTACTFCEDLTEEQMEEMEETGDIEAVGMCHKYKEIVEFPVHDGEFCSSWQKKRKPYKKRDKDDDENGDSAEEVKKIVKKKNKKSKKKEEKKTEEASVE